ncbi:MAG: late competence development ComFB family protein [Spirochaetaceae bacterium]|jgi:competence protein ComFB|nr:late competence development ComFB family protein [Spirochaetaceae bacterium]
MALTDRYDFEHLKNEAEALVFNELEKQLAERRDGLCRCNECLGDMAAMVLNTVKPLYRFSLLGALYASEAINDEAYARSLRDAVADAIEKVSANPSHPPQEAPFP